MIRFYSEELLAPRPNPKLEEHLLSAVLDCLFSIFAATLHTGDRSSIRYLRALHAVATETHFSRMRMMMMMMMITIIIIIVTMTIESYTSMIKRLTTRLSRKALLH
jgi:hypothetical protein